ncbi:MAG TPA: cytochrome c biogenesis protein CcsA [Gemmatimonadaceae bacterium]|nr:cytochrome c biogenesis protein CcsA [Gemmatimonadaceae bacterium]
MIVLGEMSLWVALLMAGWSVLVSSVGGATHRPELVASGERGIQATLILLIVASAGLGSALLARDFSIGYVASHTSANLPTIYTVSAFWAGRGGSLLLWSLLLAGCSVTVLRANRSRSRDAMPYVAAVLAAVMLVLLVSLLLVADPFERLSWTPPEGRGLSPQLQSPEMAVYLPVLYLGYAATTIPFAFAVAALVRRRITAEALVEIRRWAVASWFFTTAGWFIGMRWAYLQPDRRADWAWHSVESASLLVWIAVTTFLVSVTVQERRGVVRKWNIVLVMSGFLLAIFATLSPGSGIISGVRSLAQSPGGMWIAGVLAAAIVISGVLVIDRLDDLEVTATGGGSRAESPRRYGAYLAGVGVFLLFTALAARSIGRDHDVTLRTGDAVELTDPYGSRWRFVSEGVSRYLILNRRVTAATMSVYRDGAPAGLLTTEQRQHVDSRGAPTHGHSVGPGVIGTPRQDVYAALAGVSGDDMIALRISFNPLMWLVWFAAVVTALGGLIMFWPGREWDRVAVSDAESGE